MKREDVPQDSISTYGGHQKLFYAVDGKGEYTGVQSSGWQVEAEATQDAIAIIERQRDEAWERVRQGLSSPLEFHMYNCRMDVPLLAQATGLFQWRVRRHFKPERFKKLSRRIIARYCDALGLDARALYELPESKARD